MVDDKKVSSDLCLLPDLNDDSSPPFKSMEFDDSTICDLLNLGDGESSPNYNPFIGHFVVEPERPRVYIAPRVMINHQDSFSLDSGIEDARILPMQDLRVPGSPRAFVHPRQSGSPRFGSPTSPVLIDTAAPFESVKEAVSKFGGITDWKAHKIQTIERRKTVDQELEKIHENMPEYKKQADVAEEAKQQIVIELESTRSVIQVLKLELEKAEKEEQQAIQDSDLAKLRVEEMEQGIADEVCVAAKAQLDMAKARHSAAVSELDSLRDEIETVCNEYDSLLRANICAAKKAQDSVSQARDVEKKMEGLSIEVITTKELLESAHAAHLEAQGKKFDAIMARDQDVYNREKELKTVEDEIVRLRQEVDAADDVRIKLETASALEHDLKAEIEAYKDADNNNLLTGKRRNNSDIQAAVDSARKELEQVKSNIEKANSEVKTLKIIVGSLQSELKREKKDLADTKEKREVVSGKETISTEITKKLQDAGRDAEEAKALAVAAREELRKAKEEWDEAKKGVCTIESQISKAKKETEAARASEKLALAAIKALQETQCANKIEEISSSPRCIIISVEEYYELSKNAHEVEEAANRKLAEIVSQIEVAKEEESKVLEKLEEVKRETVCRKLELKEAMGKVEKARDGKEQELRKWRSENAGKRGTEENLGKSKSAIHKPKSYAFGEQGSSNVGDNLTPETKKKNKRFSLLPKVFMFLSRKKSNK